MIFDKNDFGSKQTSHLKFRNDFEINIEINKANILFGFNGLGKTCISKCLLEKYPNDTLIINYDDIKDTTIAGFKRKKLVIKPYVKKVEEAKRELETQENILNVTGQVALSFNCPIKSLEQSKWNYLKRIGKKGELQHLKITDDDFVDLNFLLDVLNEIKNNLPYFYVAKDFTNEYDHILHSLTKTYAEHYLHNIQYSKDDKICPICGKKVSSLEKILENKIKSLEKISHSVFQEYLTKHTDAENKVFLSKFTSLMLRVYRSKKEQRRFCEYILCDGNKTSRDELNEKINHYRKAKEKLKKANKNVEEFYNMLKADKSYINNLFTKSYDFKKIEWDDLEKSLSLTSKRDLNTYSTGELNFLTFIINLIYAKSSNRRLIIFDDPLSSYDIPNQYKIIFEIVNYITTNEKKKVLIFTHNPETINIASSQRFNIFEFSYIDKVKGELIKEDIDTKDGKPMLDVEKLLKLDDTGYLSLNKTRRSKFNKIFHYDESYSISKRTKIYSNEYLCDLIINFDESKNHHHNFNKDTVFKCLYLLALRTYVEKMFYIGLQENGSTAAIKNLMGKNLYQKINIVLPIKSPTLLPQYINLTRDSIIRKKSMLNTGNHFYSSQTPFYFATNVSFDELINEIKEIKELFKK